MSTRREFIQKSAIGAAGLSLSAKSYSRILGSNDKVRVGIVGFSDRFRSSLAPAFLSMASEYNFEIVAVSDLWNKRRDEAELFLRGKELTSGKHATMMSFTMGRILMLLSSALQTFSTP